MEPKQRASSYTWVELVSGSISVKGVGLRIEAMHTTLYLRAGSTKFESDSASLHPLLQRRDVLDAYVLKRVLHASVQIWQKRGDRALVLHIT